MKNKLKKLGLFSIVMITIGSVDSIRNLPATALIGSSLIFYYIVGVIFFLLPCSLVSAEMASMWEKEGGVYIWVKEAFGKRLGFLAIWLQWVQHVMWFPTILSFIGGTLGFIISPEVANNKFFLVAFILILFWATTLINLYGIKSSAKIANFCSIAGILIPVVILITLSVQWLFSQHSISVHFGAKDIIPHHFKLDTWVALIGIVLSFCGIEVATVHVRDVKDPQSVFPKSLLYSTIIILITLVLGSLAIAIVIPHDKINVVTGIIQTFKNLLAADHISWLLPVIAIMLALGSLGGLNNWVIAPLRGLVIAGNDGNLPAKLCKENEHHAPKKLLLIQACIVTFLSAIFILMPSVNGSYWLLTVLSSQLYMLMYVLMFAAAIYLRFSRAKMRRTFHVLGGKMGMCAVAGAGILSSIITFASGFISPRSINVGGFWHYDGVLIIGIFILTALPFVIRKKSVFPNYRNS